MPIYEYRCEECGATFERIVFASDSETSVECPECGKTRAKRLLSAFSCGSGEGGTLNSLSSGCSPSGGFS